MTQRMTHNDALLPYGEPYDWNELDMREKVLVIDEQWMIWRWKQRVKDKAPVWKYGTMV